MLTKVVISLPMYVVSKVNEDIFNHEFFSIKIILKNLSILQSIAEIIYPMILMK